MYPPGFKPESSVDIPGQYVCVIIVMPETLVAILEMSTMALKEYEERVWPSTGECLY